VTAPVKEIQRSMDPLGELLEGTLGANAAKKTVQIVLPIIQFVTDSSKRSII
jgi:hypothetical protein